MLGLESPRVQRRAVTHMQIIRLLFPDCSQRVGQTKQADTFFGLSGSSL
jgi:hypothetical protein